MRKLRNEELKVIYCSSHTVQDNIDDLIYVGDYSSIGACMMHPENCISLCILPAGVHFYMYAFTLFSKCSYTVP